ncbi:phage recombination protein Bet [Pasteurella canis]|uniref:phage recombination protein Bet n=1 Tax=Pasteurella canis TaxID=753 RepID=UPI0013213991|nr:phage recombination protein Bet [Pasteurella canis]MXN88559.1 phage recombination protein Bet [Pasteurella canis]
MTSNLPANIQAALSERKIDAATWTTLQNSVFPGAKDESILLAIDYCKARKLDILKKPCHIVPMQVTLAGERDSSGYQKKVWRDVIMPGIYEQRITAFRTGQMAGQDEPVFGEIISYLGVNAPEWCKVTVYRFINGERCSFSHTEYFSEACSLTEEKDQNGRKTGVFKVNSVWTKRPRGQLAKCAEAGALRKAFPDELGGVITADEVIEEQTLPSERHNSQIIEGEGVELITPEQIELLTNLIKLTGTDVIKALAYYGADSLERLPKEKADHFIKKLNQRLDEQSANISKNDLGEEIPL